MKRQQDSRVENSECACFRPDYIMEHTLASLQTVAAELFASQFSEERAAFEHKIGSRLASVASF